MLASPVSYSRSSGSPSRLRQGQVRTNRLTLYILLVSSSIFNANVLFNRSINLWFFVLEVILVKDKPYLACPTVKFVWFVAMQLWCSMCKDTCQIWSLQFCQFATLQQCASIGKISSFSVSFCDAVHRIDSRREQPLPPRSFKKKQDSVARRCIINKSNP